MTAMAIAQTKLPELEWRGWFFVLGILGGLQFLVLTSLAMYIYPGGTVHQPDLESYSFLYNFFSDLGRTRTFRGVDNGAAYLLFTTALSLAGFTLMLFFIALPGLFKNRVAQALIVLGVFFGILASACYLGIAAHPWNLRYYDHTFYVRLGFIAFLMMAFLYALAILAEPDYPNHYAYILFLFIFVLGTQIVIMLFGPRAYRSNEALYLQAVAQKVVVYAEIACMIYLAFGAFRLHTQRALLSE